MQRAPLRSMLHTHPESAPHASLTPEPTPLFTPAPTPPHKPTQKKVAPREPAAATVLLPTRRSKRKIEAAEPQPQAAELHNQEEVDYYLVQHCEACGGRKRRHTCGKKLYRGKWHQIMAARKAADEAVAAPQKLKGEGLPPPPVSEPTAEAALLLPSPSICTSAAPFLHQDNSSGRSRNHGEASDCSSGSESPDSAGLERKAKAHPSTGNKPSSGGARASAAFCGTAGGGGSPLGAGLAHTLPVVESNATALNCTKGTILAPSDLDFCGPLLPPPLVTSDGMSRIPSNNSDFGANLNMVNAGTDDFLFLMEDLLTDEY